MSAWLWVSSLVSVARGRENCTYPISDPGAEACSAWRSPLLEDADGDANIGCPQHRAYARAPRGLAFVGLSLSRGPDASPRYAPTANAASVTHQTAYDFDAVQDRGGRYLCASNDDGWLSGGGNAPASFVLANVDSTHVELAHVSTTASDVAADSASRPETRDPLATGLDLRPLLARLAALTFAPIAVLPTGGAWTPTHEFQVRFNPYNGSRYQKGGPNPNPTTTALYEKAICALWDVAPLDKTDPFHASIVRDASFCGEGARESYFDAASAAVARMRARGPQVLNDAIDRYRAAGPGGFYLFVTRNRPLVYFAPPSAKPFLCRWTQDGAAVHFANPYGGPVVETLVPIDLDAPFERELAYFDGLKDAFAFHDFPEPAV